MNESRVVPYIRNVLSVSCAAALLVLAAFVARGSSNAQVPSPALDPLTGDVRALAVRDGVPLAGRDTSQVVVVFQDLECPACRQLHPVLRVLANSPEAPSFLFRHFPLPEHHNALSAAIAAECARPHGQFAALVDGAFEAQDSLGSVSWPLLAAQAGIVDTASFGKCLDGAEARDRVERDVADARLLKVPGTPYILVGRYPVLGVASLDSLKFLLRLEHDAMALGR